jgi:hypothetical protein
MDRTRSIPAQMEGSCAKLPFVLWQATRETLRPFKRYKGSWLPDCRRPPRLALPRTISRCEQLGPYIVLSLARQ